MGNTLIPGYAGVEYEVGREVIERHAREMTIEVGKPDAPERATLILIDKPDDSDEFQIGLVAMAYAVRSLVRLALAGGRKHRRLRVLVVLDDGDTAPPAVQASDLHA